MATRSTALLAAIVALFAIAGGLSTVVGPSQKDSRKKIFTSDSGPGTVAPSYVRTLPPMIYITELGCGFVALSIVTQCCFAARPDPIDQFQQSAEPTKSGRNAPEELAL